MKIICADRVSVGLSYDANVKWHMPIWGKICHAEQKIYSIWSSPSAICGKKHSIINKWIDAALRRMRAVRIPREIKKERSILDFRTVYFCRPSTILNPSDIKKIEVDPLLKCLTSKSTENSEAVPTQYFRNFIKYEKSVIADSGLKITKVSKSLLVF